MIGTREIKSLHKSCILSYNPLFFLNLFLFFYRKVISISKWGQGVIAGRRSPILMAPLYVSARALALLR